MRVRLPLIARRYGVGFFPTFLCPWCSGNTSAFQADFVGSIPTGHSKGQPLSPLQVSFAGPHLAAIVQLAKTPPSQGGDRRFEPGWQYKGISDGWSLGWLNNPYGNGWGVRHIMVMQDTNTAHGGGHREVPRRAYCLPGVVVKEKTLLDEHDGDGDMMVPRLRLNLNHNHDNSLYSVAGSQSCSRLGV